MRETTILLWLMLLFSTACSQNPPKATSQSSGDSNNNLFRFAIVGDRTGGERMGIFPETIEKLMLLQPDFVMSVGDLIEGYTADQMAITRQWDEFDSLTGILNMPFYHLPGNHDYSNLESAMIWEKRVGPPWYHFTRNNILFLCLNSEEALLGSGKGGIEEPQFKYLKNVLEENRGADWTMVFIHQPLWLTDSTRYWPEVEVLLSERNHTVFAGHKHRYLYEKRNNGEYIILGTSGGFSRLRGPDFGEFDHLVWVTMTAEGPVISNILIDGVMGKKGGKSIRNH